MQLLLTLFVRLQKRFPSQRFLHPSAVFGMDHLLYDLPDQLRIPGGLIHCQILCPAGGHRDQGILREIHFIRTQRLSGQRIAISLFISILLLPFNLLGDVA